MARLDGTIAVVTGAGRGIGREITLAFAKEGATLALAARSPDALESVALEVKALGGEAVAIPCDVTDQAAVDHLADQCRATVGDPGVLVNCAGVHIGGRFQDLPIEEFQRLIEVNYIACVRVIKAFLPAMEQAGWGRIINIASTAGKWGSPNQSPYNASKHAVVGLTRCLAIELAKTGVTANAICPGFVETDMADDLVTKLAESLGVDQDTARAAVLARVPMGRMVQVTEIAPLAVYLASAESSAMTGQSLSVCGGLVLV